MIFPGSGKENAYFGHTHADTHAYTHLCVYDLFRKGLYNTVIKIIKTMTYK